MQVYLVCFVFLYEKLPMHTILSYYYYMYINSLKYNNCLFWRITNISMFYITDARNLRMSIYDNKSKWQQYSVLQPLWKLSQLLLVGQRESSGYRVLGRVDLKRRKVGLFDWIKPCRHHGNGGAAFLRGCRIYFRSLLVVWVTWDNEEMNHCACQKDWGSEGSQN